MYKYVSIFHMNVLHIYYTIILLNDKIMFHNMFLCIYQMIKLYFIIKFIFMHFLNDK